MRGPVAGPSVIGMSRKKLVVLAGGGAAVAAAALVAAILLTGRGGSTPPPATGAAQIAAMLRGVPQNGAVLGRANAPVTLLEFADPQCPYCRDWEAVALPSLVARYVRTGKVRIVFNGVSFLGADSETALRTALAAGRQNRLWDVLALLFANQGTENAGWVSEDLLRSIGRSVDGLDWQRMLDARQSAEVDAALTEASSLAQRAGVNGVPAFAVGKTGGAMRMVKVSSLDEAGLRPALEAALKG